jgi:sphingomyelin phosphodiesterase
VKTLKILHLADIHMDPLYEVGAATKCKYSICCQSISGTATENDAPPAGVFGDYEPCDTPRFALRNAFEHILDTHKVQYRQVV